MRTSFISALLLTVILGCPIILNAQETLGAPPGGVAVVPNPPIWLTGIMVPGIDFLSLFPKPVSTDHLQVVNAGYYLLYSEETSQLAYMMQLNVEKKYQDSVFLKWYLTDPLNPSTPFTYEGELTPASGSTRITHNNVKGVRMGDKYHIAVEVYSDRAHKNMIEKIDQELLSPVENTTGCVNIQRDLKNYYFGRIPGPGGVVIPLDKVVIACQKK